VKSDLIRKSSPSKRAGVPTVKAMEDISKFRSELKQLKRVSLLKLAFSQKEGDCALSGPCPFYLIYRGYGFCVSELLGESCQAEKLRDILCDEDGRDREPCPDVSSQLDIELCPRP
jgi:hypothetical protein